MLDQLQCMQNHHKFQATFHHLRYVMRMLLSQYAPRCFTTRRNFNHVRLDDASILALMLVQVEWGITSQSRFCRIVHSLWPNLPLLERSRFNRRSRELLPVIQTIRQGLTAKAKISDVAIIDSFPVPVCQNIRNQRVRIFRGYADVGYNATKRMWFYGFKVHVVMEGDGTILNYVVTKASVHDAKEAPELIMGCPCPEVLADVGYVGKKLIHQFEQEGYLLWTPYRSNMKGAEQHNSHHLKKLRRRIESCFSKLNQYKVEENTTRTLSGFQTRLELIILAYNLQIMSFITN